LPRKYYKAIKEYKVMSNHKLHVRRDDTVYVLTGKNRGMKGKILKVFPDEQRVLVEKINIVTKHKKPQRMNPGGLVKQEAPIHVSNVMLICEKCKQPTKVGKRVLESGEKVRVCKRCREIINTIVAVD
jgi:large subunit ribosomal protein L24